ncbi:hypothetical protein B0H14DRAFT_3510261 [Mycena olivaceomarginata]|nr:hypothetical protein B0H14DRAFT_3510261 [Mycena olivaceomarginata]
MSTSSLLARSQQRKQRRLQENVTPSSPAPASTSLPPAGGMTPGGSLGVKSSPNPFSNTSSYNMFPPPTRMGLPLIAQLKNFGDRTVKQIKLSDESEAEFKRYLETNSKEERDALQFIHTLELKDMLVKSSEERSENWTPSSKLAKQIRKFIHALLLLPNIQYYSVTIKSTVITAMRSSSIKDLPAADRIYWRRDAQGRLGEDDNEEDCFDFSLLRNSEYHPYPSKTAMLLDVMDNLPRCRFTSAQMSLVIHFAKQLSMPDVPSLQGLCKIQQKLQSSCGSKPAKTQSHLGNIFYMNNIRDSIARDMANPLVAPHMHFYPEENDGPISETYQAERWMEYTPSQLTPMFSRGFKHFWIEELACLQDGTFVIPHTWIIRNGVLTSDVSIMT